MKISGFFLLVLAFSGLGTTEARAEWWVDAAKLHISAHMENSCLDCHGDIADRGFHPNPADVDKSLADFFSEDTCLDCHDDVMDDLDGGVHGNEEIRGREELVNCIRCHKPHSQPRLDDNRIGAFDPKKPDREQCGVCHDEQSTLPVLSEEDQACMACHGRVDPKSSEGRAQIEKICLHCHGLEGSRARELTGALVSPIDTDAYRAVPHADLACTECHSGAAGFNHSAQESGDCRRCHLPHDEKIAGDLHAEVRCGACHLGDIEPVRDAESRLVSWEKTTEVGAPSKIHEMARLGDEEACRRCHSAGNQVGAAAMLLPPKSIMCMSCHSATLSVGDTPTIVALIVFLIGMVNVVSFGLSGSIAGCSDAGVFGKLLHLLGSAVKAVFSPKIISIAKTMVLDVLLQRRLYRQSGKRWLIHSLIFFPFVFRFFWGMISLIGSLCKPEWGSVWSMLDKNHPVTALLFDLTGIMIVLGVGIACLRGRQQERLDGMPAQDRVALRLIGSIVMVGFLLEGMRIAMTGWPEGAGFAVVGYGISLLFGESTLWTGVYGYLWYAHAILTGLFVAYLPFSRLLHIIMAPVVLAMDAGAERE